MSKEKVEELLSLSGLLYEDLLKDEFLLKDTKSQEIMTNLMKNLKERRYVVSVIAAMKAGKSTTFNALLGRDILPNENASCTTAVTEIKHTKNPVEVVQKVYKNGEIASITSTIDATLEENFHADVRYSRKHDEVKEIDKYYLETPVAAIEDSVYSELVQNFILVDTPGPNEANVGDFDVTELQKIALEKLRYSDALIMLFDYQTYKSDTNARILKSIFDNREDLEQDQGKIYFLINKIDAMTVKDGSVEDVIENVKQLIREYAPVISNPNVFAFSAKQASLARSFIKGNANEHTIDELRKYAVDFESITEINGKMYRLVPEPEEYVGELLEESNILDIEKNIIERMFEQASEKMLANAHERISQVTQNITKLAQAQIDISSQNEGELSKKVNESKKKIENLRNETQQLTKFTKQHLKDLKAETKAVLEKMPNSIEAIVEKTMPKESKLEGPNKEILMQQARMVRNQVIEAIQFNINREVDKIQRLIVNKQTEINQGLNREFVQLSYKANEVVGKQMTLQFQVFNLDDIAIDSKTMNFSKDEDVVNNKKGGKSAKDPIDNLIEHTLAGAGTGFGAGVILPGIGNIAGALVGGIAGLISAFMQNNANEKANENYFVDLTVMKKSILVEVKKTLETYMKEIDSGIEDVSRKYSNYVELQMNGFIDNLKKQLDQILGEFMKNKHDIDSHVRHMKRIQEHMEEYVAKSEQVQEGQVAALVG